MKNLILFILNGLISCALFAQERQIPIDTLVVTNHTTNIKGFSISYQAQTGTQPVWNEDGKPMATLFYTYYKRTNDKSKAPRPIIFSFNGGPGSASVWMHVAYTGPNILRIDSEGYPVQPYGFDSNPYSILDVADIVFINPVNTGYSRIIEYDGEKEKKETFFGVNEDIKYLAEWMNTFVNRKELWEAPKYIIGESYGGTRVMGLSLALQNQQWMYLNGVIMVSPADYKIIRSGASEDIAMNLPYFTATAWYHKMLPADLQQKDLEEILPEAELFSYNELLPAISKGGNISTKEKERIATKMARFTGIKKHVLLQQNLEMKPSFFWKELLRDTSGKTLGRLDSRYLGIDREEIGTSPDYSPELTAWLHSFTPAINYYTQNILNFKTDVKYNMFGPVHPWDFEGEDARESLRQAMAQNPYLQLLVQSGYYDGATTYGVAKYTMGKIDPSGKLKNRMSFKGYRSGHMMYLRKEDLKKSNEDLRVFIQKSSQNIGAAKY
jgi:carboxypeptidase C (cathepsin A)